MNEWMSEWTNEWRTGYSEQLDSSWKQVLCIKMLNNMKNNSWKKKP